MNALVENFENFDKIGILYARGLYGFLELFDKAKKAFFLVDFDKTALRPLKFSP